MDVIPNSNYNPGDGFSARVGGGIPVGGVGFWYWNNIHFNNFINLYFDIYFYSLIIYDKI